MEKYRIIKIVHINNKQKPRKSDLNKRIAEKINTKSRK